MTQALNIKDTQFVQINNMFSLLLLQSLAHGLSKGEETKGRNNAEQDGHGLPGLDSARIGGSCEDDGSEEGKLNTVRLAVLHAISAQAVYI